MTEHIIKLGGKGVGGREVGERLWSVHSSAADAAPFSEELLLASDEAFP